MAKARKGISKRKKRVDRKLIGQIKNLVFWNWWRERVAAVEAAIKQYKDLRRRVKKQRLSLVGDFFFWVLLAVTTMISVGAIMGVYYIWQIVLPSLPPVTDLAVDKQRATTKIYDRNHRLLYNIYEDENRTPVALGEMGEWLPKATVAIEDREFWTHYGFSIPGMIRALRNIYQTGRVQGGSTITQQLVKNRLLSREKTFDRKIKEFILAILVEKSYNKNQILEMYLNDASYGGTVYGAEQAAVVYFGKNAKNLTLSEAAYLAGMTRAPSNYIPTSENLLAYGLARREEVFRRMVEDGTITEEQADAARAEELKVSLYAATLEAPHFVMYVKGLLEQEYGVEAVRGGGLEVVTTLDLDLQNDVQKVLSEEMAGLVNLRISNGAVLVTNPQTGEILTMLGSQNYWAKPETTGQDGQMNVTIAQRQPGSSIKPLVYALALQNGKTPGTLIDDNGFEYRDPWGTEVYRPQNYDGKMHGRVTLREALGSSYNIPAVKLLQEVGVGTMIDLAEKMGITTWIDRGRYGLSLALGGGEVKMTELATAYGVMPNLGDRVDLNPILEIRDAAGKTIYRNSCALDGRKQDCPGEKQVIPAGVAYQITDILRDNAARTPGFGAQSVLNFPDQEVAVKTGTTNSLRDNWTIGYITDRLVAVWVGNNDNRPMSYVASGITGASPIWQKTMKLILAKEQMQVDIDSEGAAIATKHQFKIPEEVEAVEVCPGGARKCTPNQCQNPRIEYYAKGYQNFPACKTVNEGGDNRKAVNNNSSGVKWSDK